MIDSYIACFFASSALLSVGLLGVWLNRGPPSATSIILRRACRRIVRGRPKIVPPPVYDSDDENVPQHLKTC